MIKKQVPIIDLTDYEIEDVISTFPQTHQNTINLILDRIVNKDYEFVRDMDEKYGNLKEGALDHLDDQVMDTEYTEGQIHLMRMLPWEVVSAIRVNNMPFPVFMSRLNPKVII